MTDVTTYFTKFAAEFAAALPGKVYDPVAWFGLIAGLLLGGISSVLGRGSWWILLGIALSVGAITTLEHRYLGTAVRSAHVVALDLIWFIGVVVGREIGLWLRQKRT